VAGLQVSVVHTLPSLHVMAEGTHICVFTLQTLVWQESVAQMWLVDPQPAEGFGHEAGLQKVESQVGHEQLKGEEGLEHEQKPWQLTPHKLVCGHSSWSSRIC
jgi:hypothetical protein